MVNIDSKPLILLVFVFMIMIMMSAISFAQGSNLCVNDRSICPDVRNGTTGGDLAFVDHYPKQPMLQVISTCFYLSCCVGNNILINVTWYKLMEKTGDWCVQRKESKDLCVEWEYRHTAEQGQALVFEEPGSNSTPGRYMCMASDGHMTINRTFQVKVIDCRDDVTSIKFTKPRDSQALVGSRFSQACQGDFGCWGALANDSLAWWSYVDGGGHLRHLAVGNHGRYSVREKISEDEISKASVLTIDPVKANDFGRTFICQLKMKNQAPVGFNFTLLEPGSHTMWRKYIPLIVVLCVLVGVIAFAVLLTCMFCRPLAVFRLRRATNRLPKRESWHFHDVMLVTREEAEQEEEEEDWEVLRRMREVLEEKGYSLYPLHHSGGRAQEMNDVEKCVSLIFVISTSRLREDQEYRPGFDFFFSNAAIKKTAMVFVSTLPLTRQDRVRLSNDYKEAYNHALGMCPMATWPGERGEGSWLKHANFWGQVLRFLPKPQQRTTGNGEAACPSALEEPLLTGSSLSPNAVDRSSEMMEAPLTGNSPSSDTVDRSSEMIEALPPTGNSPSTDAVDRSSEMIEALPLTGNSPSTDAVDRSSEMRSTTADW